MEGQSGLSELFVVLWVSAIQGCPLNGVPLYLSIYLSVCLSTVDREIFMVKITHVLNFREFNFRRLGSSAMKRVYICVFNFRAFNFRRPSNWRKIFHFENFPIYGICLLTMHLFIFFFFLE